MENVTEQINEFCSALTLSAATYGVSVNSESLAGLAKYYELLSAWNARLHLVAPTSPREFARRHILESLMLLEHLPAGAAIADVGSGGGLPIIPCLIARPDLRAVLIEASPKKAVFLSEALREVVGTPTDSTKLARPRVIAERFENAAAPDVEFITCRALERFEDMLPKLIDWAPASATLLLFGGEGLRKHFDGSGRAAKAVLIPNSERRFLFLISPRVSNHA